ncbi:MAG: hypothetical protein FJZ07_02035 [Candidatus Nealsonbacteria bacterium]|nr:hypothetical protein [Candidatus Nealsonbacteria bacterium]
MSPEIKNLKKAAQRILRAVKKKERIVIYGDSDLDGVTSVIILDECIKNLGGKISEIYFPDREEDGYGINEKALFYLKKHSPALFITLDCGIGNLKEIKTAKKLGFEVLIIDHHEVLDKIPEADIIVDPKQKGDKYPFKQFATVGLVFKLSEILFKNKMSEYLRRNFLELVAMATIADMMPRVDENERMIIEGLDYLDSSWRPGIQALFGLEDLKSLSLLQRVNKVNSVLNIRDIEDNLPAAFRLLTTSDKKGAGELAKLLLEKGFEKKQRIKEIILEVEEKVFSWEEEPIVFEGSSDWELVFLGVAASVLIKKYQKPVFLYKKSKDESQGSIRAPAGFNAVEAMKTCSDLLITYGGHPQAAGFRVKNENLDKFKERLFKYFR